MARRIKHSRSLLAPLAENFMKRLSNTDARIRRKIVRYGFLGLGAVFFYSLSVGTYSLPRIVRLEWQRQSLMEANRHQLVELIDAVQIRDRLHFDPSYIEYVARTRYHMAYPDEVIYRYRGR